MYDLRERTFVAPNGREASFEFRANTADENTIQATFTEDEYGFKNMVPNIGDWMIDVGGYVGSTAILYALLYPQTKIVVIEPLPENVELITKNVLRNGLGEQIKIIPGAVGSEINGVKKIYYRDDTEVGAVHKFVGSGFPSYHETVSEKFFEAPILTLDEIIKALEIESIRVLKMDAEGGEVEALFGLNNVNAAKIQTIVGEYHNTDPSKTQFPRSELFNLTMGLFEDKSLEPERPTWGSFLFERKN
ncbi:MAG: FkbM family methyltransferase [Alphaproteobacteria bacterium]|nr:MAG: FkbM family methyltransferase [Alphaproteobacteria bacterium]